MSEAAGHLLPVDRPVPGYYRTKMVRNGPWVPVRIWEEDGEIKAERNGRPVHAQAIWVFCANNPIDEEQYQVMRGFPVEDPLKPVDLNSMPPIF
jgi:hypothetical protein